MSIKVNAEMQKVVERLQGTSCTNNLSDEIISAWMKVKKCIENCETSSCMGAPLFIKNCINRYFQLNDKGEINGWRDYNNDVFDDFNQFKYNKDTLIKDDSAEAIRNGGFDIDSVICLCMGYIPHAPFLNSNGSIFERYVEFLGAYVWYLVNTEKFTKYMYNIKASWRNPDSWKSILGYSNYKLDLTRSDDLDLCTFFETFQIFEDSRNGHLILDCKVADEIREIFMKNKQFFCSFGNTDDVRISENYYLDLWFKYEFNDMLKRSYYDD